MMYDRISSSLDVMARRLIMWHSVMKTDNRHWGKQTLPRRRRRQDLCQLQRMVNAHLWLIRDLTNDGYNHGVLFVRNPERNGSTSVKVYITSIKKVTRYRHHPLIANIPVQLPVLGELCIPISRSPIKKKRIILSSCFFLSLLAVLFLL